MADQTLAVIAITSVNNDITLLRPLMPKVMAALAVIQPGEIMEI